MIFIQSNVTYIMSKYKFTLKYILESFLKNYKTVIFPAFNTDFNDGIPYNIRTTPSKMGILTEYARTYKGAVRSGHPSYSFVAIGEKAHLFNINHFSGYGKDSPFAILRREGGKVGVLGLPNSEGNTFFHHVEEMNQVPYRFYKNFSGDYTDRNGKTERRTYSFYCNGGVKTLLDPIDDLLWKAGLYKGYKPYEGNGFRVIDCNNMFDFVTNLLKTKNPEGLFYERIASNGHTEGSNRE
jgi:aminoglycoside 3-N-acetyltransferase